jgi:hypothetical protein
MNDEECITLLKGIRLSRRTPKKKTKSKGSSKKKTVDISALMQSMSVDDKKSILKDLEEYL